jgi:hypothetical protein
LLLRAARTQRCAGEGELVFGLTEHDATLPKRGRGCQRAIFASFRVARGSASGVRHAKCGMPGVGRGKATSATEAMFDQFTISCSPTSF